MYSFCLYVIVLLVLCISSKEAVFQSIDPFDIFRECNYTTRCEGLFGFSDCKNGKCECRNGFYFASNIEYDIFCQICPNFGERCDGAKCCRHSEFVACIDGFCRCRDATMDSCLHFQPSTELMIAAKLALFGIILVSLAILLMVLRRSCGGEDYGASPSGYRRDRIYSSLNSIQRFVLAKMQDRPPPYDELEDSSKPPPYCVALSTQDGYGGEAPPPYSFSMFAESTSGVSNPGFTDIPGPSDLTGAALLPVVLSSLPSGPGPSHSQAPDSLERQTDASEPLAELTRPVLTDPAVRRMSNYSTFVAQSEPETENTPGTSGLQSDPGTASDIAYEAIAIKRTSGPGPRIHKASETDLVPDSSEPVVDWLGKEVQTDLTGVPGWGSSMVDRVVQTTDLPFPEPCTSEDWLTSRLSQVAAEPGPSGVRRPSGDSRARGEQPKLLRHLGLGSLATFFISKRRGSTSSSVSDSSEPGSMSMAHDYYSYDNEDDGCSLVSHIYPAGHASPAPAPELPPQCHVAKNSDGKS